MITPATRAALTRYLPRLSLRREPASPLGTTWKQSFEAAALFADISGFTKLTEQLAAKGHAGLEELNGVITAYLGRVVDAVLARGGDISNFAGDALVAVWPLSQDRDLATAVLTALACGLDIQQSVSGYVPLTGHALSIKVSVGHGALACFDAGGELGRREIMVAGSALASVSGPNDIAEKGDVIVAAETWPLVASRVTAHATAGGHARVAAVVDAPALPPPEPAPTDPGDAVLRYIPAAVRARYEAGQTAWLAELRPLTVLFINLADLDHDASAEEMDATVRAVQVGLYRYEGSLVHVAVDDKGVSVLAAMGLPPLAHQDDPARGCLAALAVRDGLAKRGRACAIGVATGQLFCGTVGTERRSEFTCMGGTTNLAARLMQRVRAEAARSGEPLAVLCDQATRERADASVAFEDAGLAPMKGKDRLVPAYRPLGPAARSRAAPEALHGTPLVGRAAERRRLADAVEAVAADGGRVVIVEGEAGIGKSHLVGALCEDAARAGLQVIHAAADALQAHAPYFAFRSAFVDLLDVDLAADPAESRARVSRRLAESADPALGKLAPLIEAALPLGFADDERTAPLEGEVRAENTRALLVGIVREAAARRPMALVVEDGHWLDSASWALLLALARSGAPLLLGLTTRPLEGTAPPEWKALLAIPAAIHLPLRALDGSATAELVAQRLGVDGIPPAVAALIAERSQGNPLFAEEIAASLCEAGVLVVEGRRCTATLVDADLRAYRLPATVRGIVAERIDRLAAPARLLLKVASVIGRSFPYGLLRDIHPIEADRPELLRHLGVVERTDLAALARPDPDRAYTFKHVITREVAYDQLLFAQRRDLHRTVAEWYERAHQADLTAVSSLLAYHFREAGEPAKAIVYLERAAEDAARSHANEEVLGFLAQAIELDEAARSGGPAAATLAAGADAARRVRWEALRGGACYALGRHDQARAAFEVVLERHGHPWPRGTARLVIALIGAAVRQGAARALGWLFRRPPRASPGTLDAARALERLAQLHYMAFRQGETLYAALAALNLAERAGPSPELARAYANAAILAGVARLRGLGDRYCALARATAEAVGDLEAKSYVGEVTGLYFVGHAAFASARARLEEAMAIADAMGDHRRLEESLFIISLVPQRQGDLAENRAILDRLEASGRRRGVAQPVLWATAGLLRRAVAAGGDVADLAERLHGLVGVDDQSGMDDAQLGDAILSAGTLALAYLHLGRRADAVAAAERTVALARRSRGSSLHPFNGLCGVAEVAVTLAREQGPDAASLGRLAAFAVKGLAALARIYPVAEPMSLIWSGAYAALRGRRRRAERRLLAAVAAAERRAMGFDAAHAHLERARWTTDGAVREPSLARAIEAFDRIGASGDAARARALAGRVPERA